MSAGITTVRRVGLRSGIVPVTLIMLAAGLGSVVPAHASARAPGADSLLPGSSPGTGTAYVANAESDTVTPIATATNTSGTPIPVGNDPYAIALTPDGKTAYVVNGTGTVTPIATATNTPGTPIPVGSNPGPIAITPDGKTAYVASPSGTVTPIATATNTAGTPIQAGLNPGPIAITPDGKTAYVLGRGDGGALIPIATATNTPGTPIGVGDPDSLAITPDGKTVYVVADVFPGSSAPGPVPGYVTPVMTATDTAGTPIQVGDDPDGIAITPDGKTAYVSNSSSGSVTPIATATNTAGTPIPAGSGRLAITPDGKTLYVLNVGGDTVTPIATATNTAGTPIPVGSEPDAIAFTPDGKTAYVASFYSDTVTPIATATNTAGTPIPVGEGPSAIAITPTPHRAPAFTSPARYKATARAAFRFTVTASGNPAPTITEAGKLPPGVRFQAHSDGTATISGTPRCSRRRVYPIKLTAANQSGTAVQGFTLTVTRHPHRHR
jgi:YVTN family beta-propeller protein